MFFFTKSASWKGRCMTHWREQRGMDSYLPRQISQSDCENSSNCGRKLFRRLFPLQRTQTWIKWTNQKLQADACRRLQAREKRVRPSWVFYFWLDQKMAQGFFKPIASWQNSSRSKQLRITVDTQVKTVLLIFKYWKKSFFALLTASKI